MLRLFIIDADSSAVATMSDVLLMTSQGQIHLETAATLEAGLTSLTARSFDCVILDPGATAPFEAAIVGCVRVARGAPVIVVSAEVAGNWQRAIRAGAHDYVVKQPNVYPALARIVLYSIERAMLQEAQQRATLARRGSEQLLDGLRRTLDDVVIVTDASGVVHAMSAAATALLGIPATEMIGRPLRDLLSAPSVPLLARTLAESAARPGTTAPVAVNLRRRARPLAAMCRLSCVEIDDERRFHIVLVRPHTPVLLGESARPATTQVLAEIARGRSSFPVGLFQVIGLGEVRDALGDEWPEQQEKVHQIVERVFSEQLMENDLFARNHDGDYVVLFSSATEVEARGRAGCIVRAIRAAVVGARGPRARDDRRPGKRDAGDEGAIADVTTSVSSIELTQGEVLFANDLASLVASKLAKASRRMSVDANRLVHELYARARVSLPPALRKGLESSSLVVLAFDAESASKMTQLRELADAQPEHAAELDLLSLSQAAELAPASAPGAGMLVDLTYTTILQRRSFERYLELLRSLPAEVRRALVLNLTHIPQGTYVPKIAQYSSLLAQFSQARAIQFHSLKRDSLGLLELRPPYAVVSYRDVAEIIEDRPEQLQTFASRVRQHGGLVLVRDVPGRLVDEMLQVVDLVTRGALSP